MNRLLAMCAMAYCFTLGYAQGIQGSVKISGTVIVVATSHSATLTWNACQNASTYNLYRGTVHGGPYTKISSGISSTSYIDLQVAHGQTLYYVVTAVYGSQESGYSNEASVSIP